MHARIQCGVVQGVHTPRPRESQVLLVSIEICNWTPPPAILEIIVYFEIFTFPKKAFNESLNFCNRS